jgi:tRNA (guanine-N7-)-methyltransferase
MTLIPAYMTTTLDWPTNWEKIFGISRPLILDIGFGYGHSLDYLRTHRPNHNIIGLEVDNISLGKAERRIMRERWDNVRVVHGFAETALAHVFEPESLDEIHINFPDPWFKSRHAGKRLMKESTVRAMASRLKEGGLLFLATDIIEYAEMSHEILQAIPQLTNTLTTDWVTERTEPFTTKYEDRALEEGRSCRYFVYRRNELSLPEVPLNKELVMPHIVFNTSEKLSHLKDAPKPNDYQDNNIAIRFLNRYIGGNSALFEVFIHEPTLEQRIAFALVHKEPQPSPDSHTYTLKLSALGHPRSTAGVHKAARLLIDALKEISPDMEIIQDKVKTNT